MLFIKVNSPDDFGKYIGEDNIHIIEKLTLSYKGESFNKTHFEKDFLEIRNICDELHKTMPSIGWFSVSKREQCFLWVCKQLDYFINDNRISLGCAIASLFILYMESKPFMKSWVIYDHRKWRYLNDAESIVSMPEISKIVLQGINL